MDFQTDLAYYLLPRCYDTVNPVRFWKRESRRVGFETRCRLSENIFSFLFILYLRALGHTWKKRGHEKQRWLGASLPLLTLSWRWQSWPGSMDNGPWTPKPCCYQTRSCRVPLLKGDQRKLEGIQWVCKKSELFPSPKLAYGIWPNLSKTKDCTTNGTHECIRKV